MAAGGDQRGYGGGIAMFGDGILSITNSTVTGNYASFSGGGISKGEITIANSIVAGNASGLFDPDIDVAVTSNGHNLFGSEVEGFVGGDLVNLAARFLFAETAPIAGTDVPGGVLGDNGGLTETVALIDLAINPAIGRAQPNALFLDQRGEPRPSPDGHPDIGAFELEPSHGIKRGTGGGEHLAGSSDGEALFGLSGRDRLYGRAGNDLLDGGPGSDWLHAGNGGDVMIGGGAADRFASVLAHTAGRAPPISSSTSRPGKAISSICASSMPTRIARAIKAPLHWPARLHRRRPGPRSSGRWPHGNQGQPRP